MERRELVIRTTNKFGIEYDFMPDGRKITIDDFTYTSQRMGNTTLTATLKHPLCLDSYWTGKEFVEWDGNRLILKDTPSSEKSNSDTRYVHSLTFVSKVDVVLDSVYLYNVVNGRDDLDWSTRVAFAGSLAQLAERINYTLQFRGITGISCAVETGVEDSERFIEFEDQKLREVIDTAHDEWEIPYYVKNNVITFGWDDAETKDVELEYGHDKHLLDIKRNNENKDSITWCGGRGSEENIPYYYPNPTAKGEIAVEYVGSGSINDLEIDDMSLFSSRMALGGKAIYGNIAASMSNIRARIKNGTTYEETTDKPFDPGYLSNDRTTVPVSIKFSLSRTATDLGKDEEMRHVTLNVAASISVDTPIVWWECGEWDNTTWHAKYYTNILDGMVLMRDLNVYYTEGSRTASLQHSFEYAEKVIPIGYTAKYSQSRDDDVPVNKYFPGSGNVTVWVRKGTFYSCLGQDIDIMVPLAKGETKDVTVSFNLKLAQSTLSDKGSDHARVTPSVTYTLTQETSGYGWWYNGIKRSLSWFGLKYTNGRFFEGDYVQQYQVSKLPYSSCLMPPVYRYTGGMGRFYPATNTKMSISYGVYGNYEYGPYQKEDGTNYVFEDLYVKGDPREHIESFEDIKPTIVGCVNEDDERIDELIGVYLEDGYDPVAENEEEEGNYLFDYFFVKIRKSNSFNLFGCANEKDAMSIVMTSGACAGFSFRVASVQVGDMFYNPVRINDDGTIMKTVDGKVVLVKDTAKMDASQQDTKNNDVWLALLPDRSTSSSSNGYMPGSIEAMQPGAGDTFVITGITLPSLYIETAEKRLEDAIIKYMWENNGDKFSWSLKFSRDWLAMNPTFRDWLTSHSALYVKYYGTVQPLAYVDSFSWKQNTEALPEISVELSKDLEKHENTIQKRINAVRKEVESRTSTTVVRTVISEYNKDTSAESVTKMQKAPAAQSSGLYSVGLVMPYGFSVSNSPLTENGDLEVSYMEGFSLPQTEQLEKLDSISETSHTHENKDVLDDISSSDTENWNDAFNKRHTHSNPTVLENLTQDVITNSHKHSNRGTLDSLTDAMVTNWQLAAQKAHEHSNSDVLAKVTQTVIDNSHKHDNADALKLVTTTKINGWDEAHSKMHEHANSDVLDTVTEDVVKDSHKHTNSAVLDKLTQDVIDNSHDHSNKDTIDEIEDSDLDHWDEAYAKMHEHTNSAVLNAITSAKTTSWDNAASKAHEHANSEAVNSLTKDVITNSHTHSNKAVLDTVTKSVVDNSHTHSNKTVIDSITSTDVSSWKTAATNSHTHSNKSALDNLTQTVIDNSHKHTNATVLDGIDADDIKLWDDAAVKAHEHTNATALNSITAAKITGWENAAGKAHEHANADAVNSLTLDVINNSHKHTNSGVLDTVTADVVSNSHKHLNQTTLDSIADADVSSWKTAATKAHSHSNSAVLDKLTQTVIDNSHTHTNKTALDKVTTTKVQDWDDAADKAHEHGNKDVLDTITSTTLSSLHTHSNKTVLDKLTQSVIDNSHTHSNADVLDDIASGDVVAWNDAADKKHTHSNKTQLDAITAAKMTGWDNAAGKVHEHSNKAVLDSVTQSVVDNSHSHTNKAVLDTVTASVVSNSHTHANGTTLDAITSTAVSSWNTAATNSHSHSNKTALDSITAAKVALWDKICDLFDVDADGNVYVKNGKNFYTAGDITSGKS